MTNPSQKVMSTTINTQGVTVKAISADIAIFNKRWLNPSELENEYGFSKSSQSKMRMASNSSTLPFSKVGKFIRYDRLAIDEWLENHNMQGVA
jgi:hypothetical protein